MELVELALAVVLGLVAVFALVLVLAQVRAVRLVLALALALAVPDEVPEKGAIIVAAFAVVAFSIFAQGLTMPWLINILGLKSNGVGDVERG